LSLSNLAAETRMDLRTFQLRMNPKGIDISSHAPVLCPAIQNHPNDGFLVIKFPKIHSDNIVLGGTKIIGDVTVGKGNAIMENCHLRADGRPIIIGNGNNLQNGVVVHVSRSRNASVEIGNDNSFTHNVVLHGCKAGNLCFVAFGSTVNDGARLGNGTFVDTNSNVQANVQLEDGMAYAGRVEADTPPNGEASKIIKIVNVDDGYTSERPLGDITSKYSRGQTRSAQSRRLLEANRLGDIDRETGATMPAYAFMESIPLQTGSYFLRLTGSILQNKFPNGKLHQDAFALYDAIDVIFRGIKLSDKNMEAADNAWRKRKDIINQLSTELQNCCKNGALKINVGMNDPQRLEEKDLKEASEALMEFNNSMDRIERVIINRNRKHSVMR